MAYIGKQPTSGVYLKLDPITTSATTTFNLTNNAVAYFPGSAANCLVTLNGILQSPNSDYSISGSTIVFADALTSSDVINSIVVLGDTFAVGTIPDGSITTAKLTSSLTLVTPTISSIINTGTLTLPTSTDTLVGRATTDTLTNKTVTNPTITNYTESVVSIGTVTSSNTISLTSGTVQTATLTASTACTFTMPTATAGKSFILLLKQAASTGNGTATFTGVKWGTSGSPTITATAGKMDILTFVSDGTNWYGSAAQGYTP